jgi:hypothetical protein
MNSGKSTLRHKRQTNPFFDLQSGCLFNLDCSFPCQLYNFVYFSLYYTFPYDKKALNNVQLFDITLYF